MKTFRVAYFFEDIAHENFIRGLTRRAARLQGVRLQEKVISATHGSRIWDELRQFLRDLRRKEVPSPDILIVVVDGNCEKANNVRKRIEEYVHPNEASFSLVCAVPNPHIERWYLDDQQALPQVLPGARPQKLQYKCKRDRYKNALREAIRAAGVDPILLTPVYLKEQSQLQAGMLEKRMYQVPLLPRAGQ